MHVYECVLQIEGRSSTSPGEGTIRNYAGELLGRVRRNKDGMTENASLNQSRWCYFYKVFPPFLYPLTVNRYLRLVRGVETVE